MSFFSFSHFNLDYHHSEHWVLWIGCLMIEFSRIREDDCDKFTVWRLTFEV